MTDQNVPHQAPEKDRVVEALSAPGSPVEKYRNFFIGRPGWMPFARYETAMILAAGTGGALGFALRRVLFPGLFADIGRGVNFGRNLSLRCPGWITLGDNVSIDDGCSLDARGTGGEGAFSIGDRTLIARDTVVVVKQGRSEDRRRLFYRQPMHPLRRLRP